MLEPSDLPAATSVAATPALAAAAASAPLSDLLADSAADAQRAAEHERLLKLETSLQRMREEHAATQQAMATLQARLRESEAARASSPALYALSTLVVLLLIAIGTLLWRQLRMKREPAWWGDAAASVEEPAPPSEPFSAPADELDAVDTTVQMRVLPPALPRVVVADPPATPAPQAPPPRPAEPERATATENVRRELTVEELIDLEQQADFFVVLGQDEAAIDLLMGHVRSSGGTSPMPYLKLLEIYRRRGDREAYERIRERFNPRFNALASEWEIDPEQGRVLESYPDVVARLQAAWPFPSQAMELLESLLFRRGSSDVPFDLPAYAELLFLYAHARDLAAAGAVSDVDLLLPLDTSDDDTASGPPASPRAGARTSDTAGQVDLHLEF